ncbi:MAG: hypothetical protein HFH45_03565 [Bacilli bacterium]|nr:hypothetical protein [Bacilli bacterium]
MSEEEKNIYKSLFEYPTKKIVELGIENEKLKEKLDVMDIRNMTITEIEQYIIDNYFKPARKHNTNINLYMKCEGCGKYFHLNEINLMTQVCKNCDNEVYDIYRIHGGL